MSAMSLNRSQVGLETFLALFIEISNLTNVLDKILLTACTSESHEIESDWTSPITIVSGP